MREILFRGKRKDNWEWVEGYLLKVCNYATCSWELSIEYKDPQWSGSKAYNTAAVDPSTVGQFTGLTANGKKIFEGDIVDVNGYAYAIRWDEGNVEFGLYNKYESLGIAYVYPETTVVGNIHDNPELLKED